MEGEVIFLFSVALLTVYNTDVVTGEEKRFSYQTSKSLHLQDAPHLVRPMEDKNESLLYARRVKTVLKRNVQQGSDLVNQGQILVRLLKSVRPNPRRNLDMEYVAHSRKTRDASKPPVECRAKEMSCRGRCIQETNGGQRHGALFQCFCDEKCDYFQDCCRDYQKHCARKYRKYFSNSTRLLQPLDPKSSQTSEDIWNCVNVFNTSAAAPIGIWMIRSCQQNWTDSTVRVKCEKNTPTSHKNLRDTLPVVARNGKTYRNRFCALCWGVPLAALSPYLLEFLCDVSPPSHYSNDRATEFLFSYCKSIFKPNAGFPRRYCYSNTVSSCSKKSSSALQSKCNNSITGIVYSEQQSRRYRNIYCAMCDNINSLRCKPATIFPSISKNYHSSFSIIMDFGFFGTRRKQQLLVKRQTRISCPPNKKIYDPNLEVCRTTKPIAPRKARFNKYQLATWMQKTKVNGCAGRNYSTRFNISFSSSSTLKSSNRKRHCHSLDDKDEISCVLSKLFSFNRTNLLNTKTIRNKNYIIFVFELQLKSFTENYSIRALTEFVDPITLVEDCTVYRIFKSTARRLLCVHIDKFLPHDYTFLVGNISAVYINKTGEVFEKRDYFINDIKTGNVTVCRNYNKNLCKGTYVSLPLSEVDIYSNKSVYWKCAGLLYDKTQYEEQNGTILVCSNFTCSKSTEHFQKALKKMAKVVITTTGLSLSVFSSFIVLCTYMLFKELRTLPGLNLMNFTLSIALAHVLMLTIGTRLSGYSRNICTVISHGLHFTFLASFVWSSVIAIDTWRAFSDRKQRVAAKRARNYITARGYLPYLSMGWLVPLIFVFLCSVLDSNQIINIDYAGKGGCWMNNKSARFYFFGIPVALMLVINIVFFILTLRAISKTRKRSRMAILKRQQKKHTCVYIKISTLMCFSWILGYFSSISPYINHAFAISSSFQGLYIALAFVFNKRVFNLYAKLLKGKKPSPVNNRLAVHKHALYIKN